MRIQSYTASRYLSIISPGSTSRLADIQFFYDHAFARVTDLIARENFILTSNGEEAINIASAAALSSDDVILPQVFSTHIRPTYTCALLSCVYKRLQNVITRPMYLMD